MLILFDHGAPRGVSRVLRTHTVVTEKARGWERLSNGGLLTAAEEAAFDLSFTTDNNLAYQQNLTVRNPAPHRKPSLVGNLGGWKIGIPGLLDRLRLEGL
jgi:hypothetical protein